MRYYLHAHAAVRLHTRMAPVGVDWKDVLAVIAHPMKTQPGDHGCTNVWGHARNGVRIRVTYHPATGKIRTIAIADSRLK